MATEAEHSNQATRNQAFLDTIDATQYPDWVITVSFYKALHLVETIMVRRGLATGDHKTRNQQLKNNFPAIWRHYNPLYIQSQAARYLCVTFRPTDIIWVRDRLRAVETEVAAVM